MKKAPQVFAPEPETFSEIARVGSDGRVRRYLYHVRFDGLSSGCELTLISNLHARVIAHEQGEDGQEWAVLGGHTSQGPFVVRIPARALQGDSNAQKRAYSRLMCVAGIEATLAVGRRAQFFRYLAQLSADGERIPLTV